MVSTPERLSAILTRMLDRGSHRDDQPHGPLSALIDTRGETIETEMAPDVPRIRRRPDDRPHACELCWDEGAVPAVRILEGYLPHVVRLRCNCEAGERWVKRDKGGAPRPGEYQMPRYLDIYGHYPEPRSLAEPKTQALLNGLIGEAMRRRQEAAAIPGGVR